MVIVQGRIQDSRRRGRQPSGGGRQHMILPNFVEKLHEIEKILGRGGRGRPPKSATVVNNIAAHNLCI